uniref:Uncharacterized protein n=1 Tax=Oryza punctata TaxID=4537 RepID=A0A0E0M3G2_ORYPU
MAAQPPAPAPRAPWRNYRIISGGHHGCVRTVAFDPSNHLFFTGAGDRTVKGTRRLTLTGHVGEVRALAVSHRHPYLFSAGDDGEDLEHNQAVRSYHGHLAGVHCLAFHPAIDVLITSGGDAICRVWDVRTRAQVFALAGHPALGSLARATDPQVITGSHDATIQLWDLAAGKTMLTLAHHKKSIRAMALHPAERSRSAFASAAADGVKKFSLPGGELLQNMSPPPQQTRTILNSLALNQSNVGAAGGGDDGIIRFLDWRSGHCFQQEMAIVHPGSLESEACICAVSFDVTGSRLYTCGADKTIKMWRELY